MSDFVAASNRVMDAYNAKDFAALRRWLSPTIDMAHFNRNYAVNHIDDLMGAMELFAGQLMKNRKFETPERIQHFGNVVIRASYWGGTPDADIPGFAKAGEPLRIKLCSIMRFDENQILIEWKDYG